MNMVKFSFLSALVFAM